MEKVRINNDLLIKYTVLRDGLPESFVGATNIAVEVRNEAYGKVIPSTFSIVDNVVNVVLDAKDCVLCGKHRVTLSYNRGNDITIDALAFELVQFTSLTGGTEIVGVEIVTVNISGDIGINRDGLSAYEVWEAYPGNEGKTIEQYFEWLRENPTKVDTSRTIAAGNGLTGGGSLTEDRTININPADDSLTVTADNIKVNTNNTLTSTSATQPLSANQGKELQDNKADKLRKVNAGAGLTGGGNLVTDRTIDVVSANDGITVNADNIQLNTIDNVTSTSATKPLSANQGKVLNDKVVQVETDLNELDLRVDTIITSSIEGVSAQEVIDARGGHPTLGSNINTIKRTHNSDTEESLIQRPVSMRNGYKSKKPIVTFIDDDGYSEVYTILRPIAVEKGFKFNVCVYASAIENSLTTHMTVEQLLELQSDGHEIMSHGYGKNARLDLLPKSEYLKELYDSKMYLKSVGLNINSFVYQGGGYNDAILDIIPAFYDSAFTVQPGINCQTNRPLDGFKILRESLDTLTIEQLKSKVDLLNSNNGWLVFTSHMWYSQWATQEKQQDLKDLIDYIKSLGIDIVTASEGNEIWGNIYDYGRLNSSNWIKIDRRGEIINPHNRFFSNPINTIMIDTPPSYFRNNSINITYHNSATTATGFPESNVGTLKTVRGLDNLVEQIWYPYKNTNTKLYRYKRTNNNANYNLLWNDWVKEYIYNVQNEFEINSSDPNYISYPGPGKLTQSRITSGGYYTEEYDLYNSGKKYKRYKKTDGSYTDWVQFCFKKRKDFTLNYASIPANSISDLTLDVLDLGLTTSDVLNINYVSGLPANMVANIWHNGTTATLRLYNAGSNTIISGNLYIRLIALINQ